MIDQTRLPFELEPRAETGTLTAYGGVPLLIEAFRVSGAAGMLDERVALKRRQPRRRRRCGRARPATSPAKVSACRG